MEEILFLEWEDYKNNRTESRVRNQKGLPEYEGCAPVELVCFPSLEILDRSKDSQTEWGTRWDGATSRGLPSTRLSCSLRLVLSTQLLPGSLP